MCVFVLLVFVSVFVFVFCVFVSVFVCFVYFLLFIPICSLSCTSFITPSPPFSFITLDIVKTAQAKFIDNDLQVTIDV